MTEFVFAIVCAALLAYVHAESAEFVPGVPDCAFNFTVYDDAGKAIEDFFGYNTDSFVLQIQNHSDPAIYFFIYCDLYHLPICIVQSTLEGGSCFSTSANPQDVNTTMFRKFLASVTYDTSEYPKGTECPHDGQTGCEKYCDSKNYCLTVDDRKRLLKISENGRVTTSVTYNEGFDPSAFIKTDCNGGNIDTPWNSCLPMNRFTPELPDCEFNYTMTVKGDAPQSYFGYITNETAVFQLNVLDDRGWYISVRCDMKNEKGECWYHWAAEPPCEDGYQSEASLLEDFLSRSALSEIDYVIGEYPKDADCPKQGQSGCKKYCDQSGKCDIVDANNRLLRITKKDSIISDFTHYGSFDPSQFANKDCNETRTIPPPVSPCEAPKSSSSTVSSTSITSSTPVTSSASFAEVAFSVVVAALLLTL